MPRQLLREGSADSGVQRISAGTGSRYGGICSELTGVNGNISADPLFAGASDFRLQPGSPAIDAGISVGAPSIDIEGNARPRDGNADGVALWDMGAYELLPDDSTPPSITVPADITIAATAPGGAPVSYRASAMDDVDGSVPVACSPASGSVFPIGTTVVTCTASDVAGNEASGSFEVHVKGASEQLDDLIASVTGLGPGSSLVDKLNAASAALDGGGIDEACERLQAFAKQANAQSGKALTPAQATEFVAAANRIRAVLDC